MCRGTWTQFTISGCCFQEDGRPSQQPNPGLSQVNLGRSYPCQLTLWLRQGNSGHASHDADSCPNPMSLLPRQQLARRRHNSPHPGVRLGLLAASPFDGLEDQTFTLLPQILPCPRGRICLQ